MSDPEDIHVELELDSKDTDQSKNMTQSPGVDGEDDEEIYAQGSQGRQTEAPPEKKDPVSRLDIDHLAGRSNKPG